MPPKVYSKRKTPIPLQGQPQVKRPRLQPVGPPRLRLPSRKPSTKPHGTGPQIPPKKKTLLPKALRSSVKAALIHRPTRLVRPQPHAKPNPLLKRTLQATRPPPRLSLRLSNLPPEVTPQAVVDVLQTWGKVRECALLPCNPAEADRPREARLVYQPPPTYPEALHYAATATVDHPEGLIFIQGQPVTVTGTVHAAAKAGLTTVEHSLVAYQFNAGVLLDGNSFLSEWTLPTGAVLTFNETSQQLRVQFSWLGEEYRLDIEASQLADPIRLHSRTLPTPPYSWGRQVLTAATIPSTLPSLGPINPQCTTSAVNLMVRTAQPPKVYRLNPTLQASRPDHWYADDLWERVTHIPHRADDTSEASSGTGTDTLKGPLVAGVEEGHINLGQWLTYHFCFVNGVLNKAPIPTPRDSASLDWATTGEHPDQRALVTVPQPGTAVHFENQWLGNVRAMKSLQRHFFNPSLDRRNQATYPRLLANASRNLTALTRLDELLPFELSYVLSALVSHGLLSEYDIGNDFLARLRYLPVAQATQALSFLFGHRQRIAYPSRELTWALSTLGGEVIDLTELPGSPGPEAEPTADKLGVGAPGSEVVAANSAAPAVSMVSAPATSAPTTIESAPSTANAAAPERLRRHVMMRKVVVTPTKIYLQPPQLELSNRILRQFDAVRDRFLRVSFRDEDHERLSNHQRAAVASTGLYARVYRALRRGIRIAGRHYEFLAFSSSQLRDHSCWFFASQTAVDECGGSAEPPVTADQIRAWMGDFNSVGTVAKVAARMGQCFSTTYAVYALAAPEVTMIPDVVHNGFTFSDGVGRISPTLLVHIASHRGLTTVPSAIQFRYGGYKGVLTRDPRLAEGKDDINGRHIICLRPSQAKFTSSHPVLELVQPALATPCTLNRQLILVLATLGIPSKAFHALQSQVVHRANLALRVPGKALTLLRSSFGAESPPTRLLATAVSAGFDPATEPYLRGLVRCCVADLLRGLKEKARIPVRKGIRLMGVMDEWGVLGDREVFVQYTDPAAPHSTPRVVQGKVVVGRNPCLHPGDLQIVEAVDHLELRHLSDVVVFSSRGPRDLPGMLSGGDLDGDMYTVIWDPTLVPVAQYRNPEPPMDYSAPPPVLAPRITVNHIRRFFLDFMLGDAMGPIANAHLAQADSHPDQLVRHPHCLALATLHSRAVDFAKTGLPAEMPAALRPTQYPTFMSNYPKRTMYVSRSVIGTLYAAVDTEVSLAELRQGHASDANVPSVKPTSEKPSRAQATPPVPVMLTHPEMAKYLPEARRLRRAYNAQVAVYLRRYGFATDIELMGGVSLLNSSAGIDRPRDYELRETLAYLVERLQDDYRARFLEGFDEAMVARFKDLARSRPWRNPRTDLTALEPILAKAAAWYHVTYQPAERDGTLASGSKPDPHTHLISFPWCIPEALCALRRTVVPLTSEKKPAKRKVDAITDKPPVSATIETSASGCLADGEGVAPRPLKEAETVVQPSTDNPSAPTGTEAMVSSPAPASEATMVMSPVKAGPAEPEFAGAKSPTNVAIVVDLTSDTEMDYGDTAAEPLPGETASVLGDQSDETEGCLVGHTEEEEEGMRTLEAKVFGDSESDPDSDHDIDEAVSFAEIELASGSVRRGTADLGGLTAEADTPDMKDLANFIEGM
ncbi:hypothetical protein IWQ60_001620 [Tieghemiomyces parasiticus]|uniref:RNA-directed RNA polymerase n=1 Tax=Tieghemiomyces parasiticus TaxID=78921 RepID=A0A9W8AEB6_9FUNG|nr:hypothetical protein IWQ60_001620 [Tieghemiomyces parasiticus]